MHEVLLMPAAWALALLGFALLSLVQQYHLIRAGEANPPAARSGYPQRAIGLIAIGAGLPLCIAARGPAFGSLSWAMLATAAAMVVALTLTWRPQWLRPLAAATRVFRHPIISNSRGP